MEKTVNIDSKPYALTSDDNYLDTVGNEFEPYMVQLFKTIIKPNYVVADIGSNIGLTSILFSNLAKKVFAFEPSPSTYKILLENLSRAKANNVEAINIGMGEQSQNSTITFAQNNRSGGFVSDKLRLGQGHVTEKISIETLDNILLPKTQQLDFIKIDVEGYEMSVIKGGLDTIKLHQPIVALELNHFCLNVLHRITVPDFLDFLRSVFPYLYAVDTNNTVIADLHDGDQAYSVMHEHLVRFRFPNLVGGFVPSLGSLLMETKNKLGIPS